MRRRQRRWPVVPGLRGRPAATPAALCPQCGDATTLGERCGACLWTRRLRADAGAFSLRIPRSTA